MPRRAYGNTRKNANDNPDANRVRGGGGQPKYGLPGMLVQKMANRKYQVTHEATGRVFLIIGHPNIHKWWANEIKGSKQQVVPISETISMRQCLELLNQYANHAAKLAETLAKQGVALSSDSPSVHFVKLPKKPDRTQPEIVVPLKVKRFGMTRSRWLTPDGQMFEINHDGKGYHCHHVPDEEKTFVYPLKMTAAQAFGSYPNKGWMIATNMASEHETVLELLYFLEPSEAMQTYTPDIPVFIYAETLPDLTINLSTHVGSQNEVSSQVETVETVDDAIEFEVELWRGRGHKVHVLYDEKDPFRTTHPKSRFLAD